MGCILIPHIAKWLIPRRLLLVQTKCHGRICALRINSIIDLWCSLRKQHENICASLPFFIPLRDLGSLWFLSRAMPFNSARCSPLVLRSFSDLKLFLIKVRVSRSICQCFISAVVKQDGAGDAYHKASWEFNHETQSLPSCSGILSFQVTETFFKSIGHGNWLRAQPWKTSVNYRWIY